MTFDSDTAVALITALSLGFIGVQILQANRLQRNQVEQDYLRAAYEAVHLPYLVLHDLAFAVDDLRRLGETDTGSVPPYSQNVGALVARYRADLTRFSAALQNAIVFGESLERIHGSGEYREVLAALKDANVSGFKAQSLFGKVIRGELRGKALADDPLFAAAVSASERAASLVAEKIIRMYRLIYAQP